MEPYSTYYSVLQLLIDVSLLNCDYLKTNIIIGLPHRYVVRIAGAQCFTFSKCSILLTILLFSMLFYPRISQRTSHLAGLLNECLVTPSCYLFFLTN